ncbi:nucleotidyltransferase family protein [Thalassospira sp.]|uniref:nucleotidyltransferase family protein n=1 Tax=Thalassospira sp. TaxID=1912094 RepID=UPI002737603C|nr:nucleotidyltransferase family protein [Thalassospira sp.]MDP2698600.1 nucleotidyltransferase family protein [Thalassospira sp.]
MTLNNAPSPQTPRLAALILAAGESARFGGRKQLADIGGKPMICHCMDVLDTISGLDLFVVLGAFADEIIPVLGPSRRVITNKDWASGMGSSIVSGIAEINNRGGYDGVLITLCDPVQLCATDYRKLIATFDGHAITATRHKNGFGVPAIFPSHLFDVLANLSGRTGARTILNGSGYDVIGMDMPNAGCDIDTRDDLVAFHRQKA